MKRSKLIFIIISILFFLIMAFFVYDFARKTTFPGKHNTVQEGKWLIKDDKGDKAIR